MIKLFPTTSNEDFFSESASSPKSVQPQYAEEKNNQIKKAENATAEEISRIVSDYDEKIKKLLISHEKELESLKIEYESLLNQKENLINSITEQYNELMKVAQSYKKDAAKWYSMVCKRQ